MRKFYFTIIVLFCFHCLSTAQNNKSATPGEPFYYYHGAKIMLKPAYDLLFVSFTDSGKFEQAKQLPSFYKNELMAGNKRSDFHKVSNAIRFSINKNSLNAQSKIQEFINTLKSRSDVNTVYPAYLINGDTLYVSNKIILKLKTESNRALLEAKLGSFKGKIAKTFNLGKYNQYEIHIGREYDVFAVAELLRQSDLVEFSQPDFIRTARNDYVPNDTYYYSEWFLSQANDADIDAPEAWSITKGNSNVIVAVMDGNGFDLTHPDLASKYVYPYDPAHGNYSPVPENQYANHGTPCAGLIGASTDNSTGVASVGFNISVMPICIGYNAQSNGSFYTTDAIIAAAASWVISHGSVYSVSNSWGGGSPSASQESSFNSMKASARGGLGAAIFASTGNAGTSNGINYPASYGSVIGVGASDAGDHRAYFSNYGDIVDIAAPGVNLYTVDRAGSNGYSVDDYTWFSGTSAACPVATALVGLLASADPTLTASTYIEAIIKSCEKVGGYTYTPGYPYGARNNELGYGRVNAFEALKQIGAVHEPQIASFAPTSASAGVAVTISGSYFTGAYSVSFGGYSALSFTVISDNTIEAVVGQGGSGDIVVTTSYGNGTIAGFTYIPTPVISSVNPRAAPVGTAVTINGSGFSAVPSDNTVYFGAVKAIVSGSTPTSLTVSVPKGSSYNTVSATTNSLTGYSGKQFTVTFPGSGSSFNANSFDEKTDVNTGKDPETSLLHDIDGDGKPDLIVINNQSNTVSVYRNRGSDGNVSFASKIDLVTGNKPNSLAIADMDGDTKPDLILTNALSNNITVHRNTSTAGSITFEDYIDYETGAAPQGIAADDIDGDGKPDIVNANGTSNTISIFRNLSTPGHISLSSKKDYATGDLPRAVRMADLDADKRVDIVVSNRNSGSIYVFRNISTVANIAFNTKLDYICGAYPAGIVLADLDGGSPIDIAVVNKQSNTVSVFRNLSVPGSISFALKKDFNTGNAPVSISASDLDGDGKADIAIANNSSGTVSVLKNISTEGTIAFEPKIDFATGGEPRNVSMGDADMDGKPDLLVSNKTANTISIFRNALSKPFITSFGPRAGTIGQAIIINGEGFNPVASRNVIYFGAVKGVVNSATTTTLNATVPLGTSFQPISITTNNLTAYSSKPFDVAFNKPGKAFTDKSFAPKININTPSKPQNVPLYDVDGDGKPDLIVVNNESNTVSIFRNLGSANTISFAPKIDLVTEASPNSIAVADIDGDGKLDLAITNKDANMISVYRNSGKPGVISFAARKNYATGTAPQSIAINDIDGDGKPDLVVVNGQSNTVSVFKNQSTKGTISIKAKKDFETGKGPGAVAIADLDADKKVDVVVANRTSGDVSVLRNSSMVGSISFIAKVDYASGNYPVDVVLTDFDGSSPVDIAVLNRNSNTVSILRNTSTTGAISFAAKLDFATGSFPVSEAVGDLDGDGKPDLAVANNTSGTVSLLRNASTEGNLSFDAKVDYVCGDGSWGVSIGDADVDGKPDVVVSNRSVGTTSIFRNKIKATTLFANSEDLPEAAKISAAGNNNGFEAGIFPNPAKDKIHITSTKSGLARVRIFDINQRAIKVYSVDFQAGKTQEIAVAQLTPGMYFVQVEMEGLVEHLKFVKE